MSAISPAVSIPLFVTSLRRYSAGTPRAVSSASPTPPVAAGSMSAVTPAICCPSSDACTLAIDSGIGPEHKWIEGRLYLRRGDWAWRDRCLYRRGALPEALRAMVVDLMDLLDRIDDLMAAQRDVGDVSH